MIQRMSVIVFFMVLLLFSIAEAAEIRYDRANRRNPFVPLLGPHTVQKESLSDENLYVEGIVFEGGKKSYAVIDGEIYREGESRDGSTIIKILPDRVILDHQNKEMVIWLREEILQPEE